LRVFPQDMLRRGAPIFALSAHALVVHIIGDFFANVGQFQELPFGKGILIIRGKFSISSSLVSQIV
jgi:hypothetical protein